ncbi:MAG: IS630 family transposase, partial [Roseovarius sp.]|nr:IS630 family transposase [Roseovarius sp.]
MRAANKTGERQMAGEIGGMDATTVRNIPRRHGLRPHQVKTFKVSRDPRFEIKVRDVAGLYVNPPDHAVVLSVDEKPRRQALGSTQTSLPMTSDHEETRTRDYRRHGTTRLLAALDVATGKVVGRTV